MRTAAFVKCGVDCGSYSTGEKSDFPTPQSGHGEYLKAHPESLLVPECDREWESWISNYRTEGQEKNIRFLPVRQVGYEKYQIYFSIEKKAKE